MSNVSLIANIADQTASQAAGAAAQLVPSGTVFHFAGSAAPTGWLICDGSAVSRTTYATLFTAIGTTYGSGDGSTTFNLPDCRGIFIAGTGSQAVGGVTYTRTHGDKQGDAMQGHRHSGTTSSNNAGRMRFRTPAGFSASVNDSNYMVMSTSSPTGFEAPNQEAHSHTVTTTAYTVDGANGTPRTAAETRPANIAMNHIIKV